MDKNAQITKYQSNIYKIIKDGEWAEISIREWEHGGSFMCISSFGNFGYIWTAIGVRCLREFLVQVNYSYFMTKTQGHDQIFSPEKTLSLIKQQILTLKKQKSISKDIAEDYYQEIESLGLQDLDSEDAFFHTFYETDVFNDVFDADIEGVPYEMMDDQQQIGFWTQLWPIACEYWKKELNLNLNNQQSIPDHLLPKGCSQGLKQGDIIAKEETRIPFIVTGCFDTLDDGSGIYHAWSMTEKYIRLGSIYEQGGIDLLLPFLKARGLTFNYRAYGLQNNKESFEENSRKYSDIFTRETINTVQMDPKPKICHNCNNLIKFPLLEKGNTQNLIDVYWCQKCGSVEILDIENDKLVKIIKKKPIQAYVSIVESDQIS